MHFLINKNTNSIIHASKPIDKSSRTARLLARNESNKRYKFKKYKKQQFPPHNLCIYCGKRLLNGQHKTKTYHNKCRSKYKK